MALWFNPYGGYNRHQMTRQHPYHPMAMFDPFFDHGFDSMFEVPSLMLAEYLRDRPTLNASGRTTEISNTDDQFKINVQVDDFQGGELNVKVVRDRFLVINGKKKDETKKDGEQEGMITREFTRSFMIPKGVDLGKLKSNLSKDGILTVEAPKVQQTPIEHERQVAIEYEKEEEAKK